MLDTISPKVPQVEVTKLYDAIKAHENFVLLDVRTQQEYAKERIKGSINLPVDSIGGQIEKIITDKNTKIYVYCLSGSRSIIAAKTLIDLGYKNIFDVKNGLLAWRVNYYPTD
jgi:rhodanese-related sulfurtransferase